MNGVYASIDTSKASESPQDEVAGAILKADTCPTAEVNGNILDPAIGMYSNLNWRVTSGMYSNLNWSTTLGMYSNLN